MGIYIKNMKMPTRCFDCPMCEISDIEICCSISIGVAVSYEEIDEQIAIQDRPSWCPLVEIPPHGRLIDADALRLLYDFNGYKPTGDMTEEEFDRLMCRLPVIRANIDDAPTIIEAEEKT